MANTFKVDIVTPGKIVYSREAVSLVVPAEFGYMGILANHAPLAACLTKGEIVLRDKDNQVKRINNIGKGFMEVLKNKVTVILESITEKEER